MAKNIELLLTENVEGTGIVGDVVKVRKGFARNFLLPRSMATKPSEAMIQSLAAKRADAQRMLAELRTQREALTKRLDGFALKLVRSCNDQGIMYGAITQLEIAKALSDAGFPGIKDREIRLGQTIKRIGAYELHVKFESDLDATVQLTLESDRPLEINRADALTEEAAAAAAGAAGATPGTPGTPGTPAAAPSERRPKDRSARFDVPSAIDDIDDKPKARKGDRGSRK
jgi:large subunit ribosomal protein L9